MKEWKDKNVNIKTTLLALTAVAALPAMGHAQGNPPIAPDFFCSF